MAMLAEHKYKQKWSLNPRGNLWGDDSSKFGQKMLEKMGWSKGKGLGRELNGAPDCIRISYKMDNNGIGYKDNNDQWTEHESNYSALLESLAGSSEKPSEEPVPKISSLVTKSKSSRARVHYAKFTRGKDLSRYSEKDLASIFGKKSLKNDGSKLTPTQNKEEQKFQNSGLMTDYFKKKLPLFSNFVTDKLGSVKKEDETFNGFGLGFNQNESDSLENETNNKKRKFDEGEENEVESEPKKKKKKKNKKSSVEEDCGVANPAFASIIEIDEVETVKKSKKKKNIEAIENVTEPKKSKKNKKPKNCGLDNPTFDEVDLTCENEENIQSPKKKKKKKKNLETNNNNEVEIIETNQFEVKPKKNKKKKHKAESLAIDNPNFDSNDSLNNSNIPEKFEVKRKNKKLNGLVSNFAPNDSLPLAHEYEVKRKLKKAALNENLGLDNPCLKNTIEDLPILETTINDDYEVKRKAKKSKKRKTLEIGLDNPCLSLNDSNSDPLEGDLMTNITCTPISIIHTPKTTITPSCTITTAKIKKTTGRKSVRFSDVTQERIIPNNDMLKTENLNELFDINSRIITDGLEDESKKNGSNLNEAFDMSEIDRVSFYQTKNGIVNGAFDQQTNNLQENIDTMSKKLEGFQAEIENDINEKKLKKKKRKQKRKNEVVVNGDRVSDIVVDNTNLHVES